MADITVVSGPYRFVREAHPTDLSPVAWKVYHQWFIGTVWVDCDGSLDWDLPDDVSQLLADSPDADRIKDAIRNYSV